MNTGLKVIVIGLLFALIGVSSALAQGVSEAAGTVQDRAGNPVQGAVVSFAAKSKPDVKYTGKSNKKGRYFVAGMFTSHAEEMWIVTIEVDGYVAVEAYVESRSVNKVLIGDKMTAKLSPGKKVPMFPIRPFGKATVNWTVLPESEFEDTLLAGIAVPTGEGGADAAPGTGGAREEPVKDPWAQALILASEGQLDESIEFFTKAVEDSPDDGERLETFAKVLFQLERHDEAETWALAAVKIAPERIDPHMVLYSIYEGRGDMEQARTALDTALEANPDDPRLLGRLGYVAGQLGDLEGAIAAYGRLTEINPDNAEAWLVKANLLADAGRMEESEAAYQQVVDLDPDNAYQTYYNLGALIIKRDNRTEADTRRAIDAFRRAWEIKPDYAKACQELAYALIGVGDHRGALEALETYVATNPSAPEADHMKVLIGSLRK